MKSMYPTKGRVILHVDMNSFYASVEATFNPELIGKPLAIAGNPEERRGIVVTCSYEARKYGIKTTMPLWEAKKLCPGLIVMKPDFEKYRNASKGIFELLRSYTTLVEPVSIDEGYMDITECEHLGSPIQIAESIQRRIYETMGLPCSVGIAPNKFLAKTASDMKKPMGITILRKRDVPVVLWPLPTGDMHGIGDKTAQKLTTIGIKTIGDLAHANELQLKKLLGINGLKLKDKANGIHMSPVDPESIFDHKSVGNSTTLPRDVNNQRDLLKIIDMLSAKVSARLKNKQLLGTKIGITIRYQDRRTITRSQTMQNPFVEHADIYQKAQALFKKHWNGDAVRLLGVTAYDVVEKQLAIKQLDLFSFEQDAKQEPLLKTVEELKRKYGNDIFLKTSDKGLDHKKMAETSFSKDVFDDFMK
ncbi:DNA polymerase IV [Bacillus sp. 1P06AnD]|uniref:DNA polymerase IV n=1 Tax=Bacillus sp. 1P06AnD TaxID=3132208 RepID=UPI0039A02A4F